ncbi:exonuclease tos [Xylocopa sonorina]|uniref:exonuclease tos n=1 Tax=Xylocopa sonorina TaxID=1818115 RepID=UPI00403A8949
MGITGLLPFLEKSSKKTNINEFAGSTVAIDSYCWLHKGVFSCADKLVMGQQTDAYVHYCMKFVNMLLSYKIKPILVFDGKHLPAKAQTEAKRHEIRETNRRKAIELMRMGQNAEARNLMRRSLDITHEMALELIKHCQKMGIDCIVAPYEADAQLAYLNISGIADIVITEDSDLILFGCKKILFKLDIYGSCVLVDQDLLHLAMETSPNHFSMNDFMHMCILSGCDYLPSLPGIGLVKARKFIKINTDCDIYGALTRLGSHLKMKSLVVTQEYRNAFVLAVITFKHQLVYCPLKRKQVRLNPPTPDITEEQLYYAGTETDPNTAFQLALGNCDPFTLKMLHNFNPDKMENQVQKNNKWEQKIGSSRHVSIWSEKHKLLENQSQKSPQKGCVIVPPTAASPKMRNTCTVRSKRTSLIKQEGSPKKDQLSQEEILDMYKSKNAMDVENNAEANITIPDEDKVSPILVRTNPFSKQSSDIKTSPSLLFRSKSRIKGRHITRIRRTIINEDVVTGSQFFVKETPEMIDECRMYSATSPIGILSKKENINSKPSMVTDEVQTDSHLTHINEECNASFVSNECKTINCLNTPTNCDLGKPHLNIPMNESQKENDNIKELQVLDTLVTLSESDMDSDFLVEQRDVDNLNGSSFKWSDIKTSIQTNSKMKSNKRKSSSISRTNVKINTNSTRRSQQVYLEERQQSLLNMFGFKKKSKFYILNFSYKFCFPLII